MEELKKFRESYSLTQREMAERIGVSSSFYEKIEGQHKKPSFNFVSKFTKAFPSADVGKLFFTFK